MAEFKRRTLVFSTGKQVKLFGNSFAIGKSLEIGEGYAPNIFSCYNEQQTTQTISVISNPHKLSPDELMELADYNIRLWMDLKDNIRRYGVENTKVFNRE